MSAIRPVFMRGAQFVTARPDGTVEFNFDLGFDKWHRERVHLTKLKPYAATGKNKTVLAYGAADFVKEQLSSCEEIVVETVPNTRKNGSKIKWLAFVWFRIGGSWQSLNDLMIDEGLAEKYEKE